MLGRPYALDGIVVRGDGRARGLGWPTANLAVDNDLLAADGVYVTRLRIPALGEDLPSVTNVGTRPTVYAEHPRLVECHVLDFDRDIYGERVELQLLQPPARRAQVPVGGGPAPADRRRRRGGARILRGRQLLPRARARPAADSERGSGAPPAAAFPKPPRTNSSKEPNRWLARTC